MSLATVEPAVVGQVAAMTQHRRALAGALLSLPLALSLVACGGTTSAGTTSSDATGSAAVGVEEGGAASASASSTVDPSIAAMIGSWAAQYGVARNTVLASLSDLGAAAQAGGDVKAAAKAVVTAAGDAAGLAPCPDQATETAYRSAVTTLRTDAQAVADSGDAAGAATLADRAGTLFEQTETALTAAYG